MWNKQPGEHGEKKTPWFGVFVSFCWDGSCESSDEVMIVLGDCFVQILSNTNKPCKNHMRRRCLGTKTCQLLFVGVSWWFRIWKLSRFREVLLSFCLGEHQFNRHWVQCINLKHFFLLRGHVFFSPFCGREYTERQRYFDQISLDKTDKTRDKTAAKDHRITSWICFGVQWSSLFQQLTCLFFSSQSWT